MGKKQPCKICGTLCRRKRLAERKGLCKECTLLNPRERWRKAVGSPLTGWKYAAGLNSIGG